MVVGLGPAGPDLVTSGALDELARPVRRFLRTVRHPSAIVVEDATTFDHLYEQADTFTDVYQAITDALVQAAHEDGEVVYAVPGSPYVLERSVRHLLADPRVDVRVVPGLSFLDLAYGRLGIDPIEAGVRLVDGHEFATAAAGERGPMLVAHAHAPWVLSDIKLAVDGPGSDEVVVLQRLGLPDEEVLTVRWEDLDRSVVPDHLTCLYVPHVTEPVGAELVRFHGIVRRLRDECPWDRQQTHQSLTRYAVEEVYELIEAIGRLDGVRPSRRGARGGARRRAAPGLPAQRHRRAGGSLQHRRRRRGHQREDGPPPPARLRLDDRLGRGPGGHELGGDQGGREGRCGRGVRTSSVDGVQGDLPALAYARELSARAAKAGFDWDVPEGTLDKVAEELDEVRDAFDDPAAVATEIGDLLFATVNLARHRGVDPEAALRQATAKFRRRIQACEALAAERDIDTRTASLPVLDALWDEVKATEPRP